MHLLDSTTGKLLNRAASEVPSSAEGVKIRPQVTVLEPG